MRTALSLIALAACASAPAPTGAQPPPATHFQMRAYTFVLLGRGPTWSPESSPETKQLFAGHMANLKAMARAGQLVVAGPFDDGDTLEGIFIFNPGPDEVRQLLTHDPAVAAGRLSADIHVWYGPAGLTYDGRAEALAP